MRPLRLLAAPLVLATVLTGVAACGSSKPNNAAACKKLQADVQPLQSLAGTTDLNALQSALNSVTGKLKSDAKQGDSTLQSGVSQLTDALSKIVSDAKASNLNAVKSDLSGLQGAGSKLDQACPASP